MVSTGNFAESDSFYTASRPLIGEIKTMATEKKVAFVTGGNRGIGLETARQLGKQNVKVVIGSRDAERGKAAAEKLRAEGRRRNSL